MVFASGLIGDDRLDASARADFLRQAPAWFGLGAAVVVLIGIRSGAIGEKAAGFIDDRDLLRLQPPTAVHGVRVRDQELVLLGGVVQLRVLGHQVFAVDADAVKGDDERSGLVEIDRLGHDQPIVSLDAGDDEVGVEAGDGREGPHAARVRPFVAIEQAFVILS